MGQPMAKFDRYHGSLVSTELPHCDVSVTTDEILTEVKKTRALFARYTSNSQIFNSQAVCGGVGWWHCVRTEPININTLNSKQRYRVRKGLKNNYIYIASIEDLENEADNLYNVYRNSLESYPKTYKPHLISQKDFIESLKQRIQPNKSDLWFCKDKYSDKVIGYAHTPYTNQMCYLAIVKIDPAYLKSDVNAALVYEICHHYLNVLGIRYICDGERNIRHQTQYQDFLVAVLGFRKAPCRLNVIYHPLFKPIIKAIYPFRCLLKPLKNCNKLIFNTYCTLYQEQCARESKKLFKKWNLV